MTELHGRPAAELITALGDTDARVVQTAGSELALRREESAIPSLLRLLAAAGDPVRAHAAAEALAGLRVIEAVPLILDKIEDPLFAYWTGSLVYHLSELDCRAQLVRVARILMRGLAEPTMNARSVFQHRRGPLAARVGEKCCEELARYADEYDRGGHRERPSEFHREPEDRYDTVCWAHDKVLEWNDLEREFPRQGGNRTTSERTPDWTPITDVELMDLVELQVARFDSEDRDLWSRTGLERPERVWGRRQVAEAAPVEDAEAFCVSRLGRQLVVYDDIADAFALARDRSDGELPDLTGSTEELATILVWMERGLG